MREREEHARFDGVSGQLREATLVVMRAWAVYRPSMDFAASFGFVLVIGFGGKMVLDGALGLGDLVAFLMLVQFLYDPIARLHQLN